MAQSSVRRTKLFNTLRSTCRLDILELNRINSEPGFAHGLAKVRQASERSAPEFLPRVRLAIEFLVHGVAALFRPRRLTKWEPGKTVFVAVTRNQMSALRPVFDSCINSEWFDIEQFSRFRRSANLWSLPFFPIMIYRMLMASGYARGSFKHSLGEYWRTYGHYLCGRRWLKRTRPACLVLSNDHVGFYRTLNKAAQDLGVKTVYIQHACVAEHFPPLAHDYALLDGTDATQKYCHRPTKTQVYQIGITKLELRGAAINVTNQNPEDRTIGVCFNLLDDEAHIRALLSRLRSSLPSQPLLVRLHPGTPAELKNRIDEICDQLQVDQSDSRKESPFEFFERIGMMICGASSIILEAALVGIPSVAFFSDAASDVYGFAKSGLCLQADSYDQLVAQVNSLLESREDVREKAEFYCAGLLQTDRPPASCLAANLIQQIAAGEIDSTCWHPIPGYSTDVWGWSSATDKKEALS